MGGFVDTEIIIRGNAFDFQALLKNFVQRVNSRGGRQYNIYSHNGKHQESTGNNYGLGFQPASRADNPIYIKLTPLDMSGIKVTVSAVTLPDDKTLVSIPEDGDKPLFEDLFTLMMEEIDRLGLRLDNKPKPSLALGAYKQVSASSREYAGRQAINNLADVIRKQGLESKVKQEIPKKKKNSTKTPNRGTIGKINRLIQNREKALNERNKIPLWVASCQGVSIKTSTVIRYFPELREGWEDPDYRPSEYKHDS